MKFSAILHKAQTGSTFAGMLALCAFSSCGGGIARTDKDSAKTDTVQEPMIQALPDTAYASVDEIKYTVEVKDSTVSGEIRNLADLYANVPGIFTFRGNSFRNAPFEVLLDSDPVSISEEWKFKTGRDEKWGGGSGWTGQPVYVQWPDSLYRKFKNSPHVTADFGREEIMVGSLDGNVYFINAENGRSSRPAIDTGNPIKGTISLDPLLNGLLYVGQGINNKAVPFGQVTINLHTHSVIQTEYGYDPKAPRGWTAYDSSAIRVGDFVFRPGENGTLYKWFVPGGCMTPRFHSALRYTRGGMAPGMESSLAVYANYGYIGDNSGNILCINLNNLRPVWMYDNHDDIDATPVLAVEDGTPYLYVACEVDKQREGFAYLTKLNALDGSKVWEYKIESRSVAVNEKHFDGGFYGTPLPGRGNASHLIFANMVNNDPNRQNGSLIALDRRTGALKYMIPLKNYAWSSPVAVMSRSGKMYIFDADTFGYAYLIDAERGEILDCKRIGDNFESSPVAVGNSVVVGSRGSYIYKIKIE